MGLVTCKDCKTQMSDQAKACPKCGAPAPKKTSLFTWLVGGFFAFVVLQMTVGSIRRSMSSSDPQATAAPPAALQQAKDAEAAACRSTIESKKAEYVRLLDAKSFWDASSALGDCPNILKDQTLIDMQTGARRLSWVTRASDPKASADERLRAIAFLREFHPKDAAPFEKIGASLQAQADKKAAAEVKRAEVAEKARKKSEGVSIGMTKEEVLASSWGRPQSINTTTYSFGVHEQWVYGGGYLYFENGILTAIQN